MTIRIGIIGFGKIAHDQHWPTIRDTASFELVATAGGRSKRPDGVPHFAEHHAMLAATKGAIDAVAICTPPGPRYPIARDCLAAGLDVLLEKPPAATLGEIEDLVAYAGRLERTLFAAWHSQFAPAVAPAKAALAARRIAALEIRWHEDVRRWHPGQDWILGAGGFGVFDPGINALSIVSRILPEPLLVRDARLLVPANRQAPIAAEIGFAGTGRRADFDWRTNGPEQWTIRVEAEDGETIEIGGGGTMLAVGGADRPLESIGEYPALYAHFAALIAGRTSDVDIAPLRLVADAFMVGARETTAAFDWA